VYNEKPLTVTVSEARELLAQAKAKNLRVGCAPDTFLGTSHQLCRQLIDDGAIGKPVAASALMLSRGPEGWHPSPEFFYQPGGGPMFDMGPYYLTALMNLLGPVRQIVGMAGMQITDREVGKGDLAGKKIAVNTPDHVAGLLSFESGVIGTITTSFAVSGSNHDGKHPIVVYGSEGSLAVPDPNRFDGSVLLRRRGEAEWTEMPTQHTHPSGRSLGLADMAIAICDGRPHRASGDLALAVLACMEGFLQSSQQRRFLDIDVKLDHPAVLPSGLNGALDQAAAGAAR
jgi:predicted dehydrogenase